MSSEGSKPQGRLGAVEIVCVLVVLAALVALAVWIVLEAGGGVLNQG